VALTDAIADQGMTQLRRALAELNIEILCASSSQAKGRVERTKLSREGITTIEATNAFMPGFVERRKDRFAVPPARPGDLNQSLKVTLSRLRDVLCRHDPRAQCADCDVAGQARRAVRLRRWTGGGTPEWRLPTLPGVRKGPAGDACGHGRE